MSYVSLHNHSEYSLLDGAIKVDALVKRAAEYGQPAVALSDHGVMSGAVDLVKAASKYGIKPIIGAEIYLEPDLVDGKRTQSSHHMTLLASNAVGYQSLIKMVSYAYLDGFYYRPRVPQKMLLEHSEGIICLSGCINGIINHYILKGDMLMARYKLQMLKDTFGDGLFVEIHDHRLEDELTVRPYLISLAREFNVPLVAANDVHFLSRSDHAAHNVLVCIGKGWTSNSPNRLQYSSELYFKSEDEMLDVFEDVPEAVHNTVRVADMCNFEMDFGTSKYPVFTPPDGWTQMEYLRHLCRRGLADRYGFRADDMDGELQKRLSYELSVIEKTGFVSYFLIVWDFIRFAREKGIPVGPGRGSAAGSIIAYCLGITNIDPLRFGLIFERFLNPDRISPPDIDIDFCMERRGEIIEYVRQKYGERCVSQIVTFGTLGAKSAIRDVGRVMEADYEQINRLAKLIPADVGITLKEASQGPEIQAMFEENPSLVNVWMTAESLEGLGRNAGVHAAGIVIADRPLDEYVPMAITKDKQVVSQFSMNPLIDLGLLKMDFLGLKTLTVIDFAVKMIREKHPGFDIDTIPMDDQAAFDIYNRGETLGVFQVEGGGITGCCKRFDVRQIDDIVAIGALFRPGPMQFLDDYILRKKGQQEVTFAHPLLEKVCADTYGIMVYQEQVQRAANVLAGYTLGQADLLRRAMGKKDAEKMAKERSRFVDGCFTTNKIDAKLANEIFDWISAFAEYGFNKSHAAAYGWLSYQTAYLKAHYPVEFMASMLTNDAQDLERLSQVVAECKRMRIPILGPDINASELRFKPTPKGILYGMTSIRNVGDYPASSIVNARATGPFGDLTDVCARVDMRKVNKKTLEGLINGGAMDSFGQSRAQLVQDLAVVMGGARDIQKEVSRGQMMMFEGMALGIATTSVPPWPRHVLLAKEKESLGCYISGHPLEDYLGHFSNPKITSIAKANQIDEPEVMARLAGVVVDVEKKYRKSDGTPFAIVKLEDFTGQMEVLVWGNKYTDNKEFYAVGNVLVIGVRLTKSDEGVRASSTKNVAVLKKKR